jgi:hypothetical protein
MKAPVRRQRTARFSAAAGSTLFTLNSCAHGLASPRCLKDARPSGQSKLEFCCSSHPLCTFCCWREPLSFHAICLGHLLAHGDRQVDGEALGSNSFKPNNFKSSNFLLNRWPVAHSALCCERCCKRGIQYIGRVRLSLKSVVITNLNTLTASHAKRRGLAQRLQGK